MTKKTKLFNPFAIDIDKDDPTYETPETKWWLIDESKSKRFMSYLAYLKESGERKYITIDNKEKKIIGITESLEQAGMTLTVFESMEKLK